MATWVVKRTTGSDANDGQTLATAKRTIAAVIAIAAAGAIINVAEGNPGVNDDLTLLAIPDNITIQQAVGQTAYEFDGAAAITGFSDDGSGGSSAILAGATVSGVTVNYAVGANGASTGFLTHATSLANCRVTNDSWFYASSTLTVRIGANLAPSGFTVEWCGGGVDGLGIPGCNGISVLDFTGRRWVDMTAGGATTGVPIIINGSLVADVKNCTITIRRIDDGGRHCVGMAGLNLKNNSVSGGVLSGTGNLGTLVVFQPNDSNAANNRCSSVQMYGHTYLNRTGTAVIASASMSGGLSHTGAGSLVNAGAIAYISCPFVSVIGETGPAFTTSDSTATASPNDWTTYPIIVKQCPITGGQQAMGTSIAFVNCDFNITAPAETGFEATATSAGQIGFFGCPIRCKTNQAAGSGSVEAIFSVRASQLWTFQICSVCHTGTSSIHYLEIFEFFSATGSVVAHGSIFGFERAHSATNDRYLCASDTGGASRTFTRNAYYNVDHYSQDGTNDTFASWNANIEGGLGLNYSTSPFLDPTTSLQLNPAHALATILIPTASYIPIATSGINGAYVGTYGAYQATMGASGFIGGGHRRGMVRDRFPNK